MLSRLRHDIECLFCRPLRVKPLNDQVLTLQFSPVTASSASLSRARLFSSSIGMRLSICGQNGNPFTCVSVQRCSASFVVASEP